MSNQQTMEEILSENEKLKQENKLLKRKNKKTKSYVLSNLELFESLLDVEGKVLPRFLNGREGDEKRNPRYFFTRPTKDKQSTEKVIRLNLLISDLIEAKIRLNPRMKDCTDVEYNTRRSMDITSLIAHLSESGGKKRVTRTRKKKESKPPVQHTEEKKIVPIRQPQGDGGIANMIAGSKPKPSQDFASMSVEDVFSFVELKENINPSAEVQKALIKQLIKHGSSARLDELRGKIGVSVPNWKTHVDSVT